MSDTDLEFWMTNLPAELRSTPIIHLAIPGSHDSGTFGITPTSKIAPDADDFFNDISTNDTSRWSITQHYTTRQQLYKGTRYFDLRVSTSKTSNLFYIVHNLYSVPVDVLLEEINAFLELHPKEVVIIDCQHFYAFESYDHKRFAQLVKLVFGEKLVPFSQDMSSLTLEFMTESNGYQVVFVYRENEDLEAQFWPSDCLPTPWPNSMDPAAVVEYLTENLKSRDYSFGYVSQILMTPSQNDILNNLNDNLVNQCFLPLEGDKYKWLIAQKPGPDGINVVISDFVEYEDDQFAKAVIALNQKLLV